MKFSAALRDLAPQDINTTWVKVCIISYEELQDDDFTLLTTEKEINWYPKSVSSKSVVLGLNISNQLEVSAREYSDVLKIAITDRNISDVTFFSERINAPLHEDYFEMKKSMPRQSLDTNMTRSIDSAIEKSGSGLKALWVL